MSRRQLANQVSDAIEELFEQTDIDVPPHGFLSYNAMGEAAIKWANEHGIKGWEVDGKLSTILRSEFKKVLMEDYGAILAPRRYKRESGLCKVVLK